MAMNISLLLAVRERILTHPETYSQARFCGTPCCIAGHIVYIADGNIHNSDHRDLQARAEQLLGTSPGLLFCCSCYWPTKFQTLDCKVSAPVAAEAIIDFIITDGWTKPADWKALAEVSPNLIPVEQESSLLTLA